MLSLLDILSTLYLFMRLLSICMEKGRTYFKQDVEFMHEMEFDTVKIDQCGSAMNMSLWAALINATGKTTFDNCIAQIFRSFSPTCGGKKFFSISAMPQVEK
eukprot:COSAG02_NODE_1742_length_11105_cov_11.079956_8_plen_102_part_00